MSWTDTFLLILNKSLLCLAVIDFVFEIGETFLLFLLIPCQRTSHFRSCRRFCCQPRSGQVWDHLLPFIIVILLSFNRWIPLASRCRSSSRFEGLPDLRFLCQNTSMIWNLLPPHLINHNYPLKSWLIQNTTCISNQCHPKLFLLECNI